MVLLNQADVSGGQALLKEMRSSGTDKVARQHVLPGFQARGAQLSSRSLARARLSKPA